MANSLKKTFNVIVGAETGILKGVNVAEGSWSNFAKFDTVNKKQEICALTWSNETRTQICVGHRDRTVRSFDVDSQELLETAAFEGGDGPFRGLEKYNGSYITAVESGLVRVWEKNDTDFQTKVEFEAGENLFRMRHCKAKPQRLATGGKENPLKLWDLTNTSKPVFTAKNVKNDWLNLRVPIWVTDLAFLDDSEKVVTCTGYHQVRVYDPAVSQRRPVIDVSFWKNPIVCMAQRPSHCQVVVGDTKGNLGLVDLRHKGRLVHCFKGFAGSIRSVQCHPTLPLVASCGLDRHVHVHNIDTKLEVQKIYLKSRLNCLLFSNEPCGSAPPSQRTEEIKMDAAEEDELWDNLEEVVIGGGKRKSATEKSAVEARRTKKNRKMAEDG